MVAHFASRSIAWSASAIRAAGQVGRSVKRGRLVGRVLGGVLSWTAAPQQIPTWVMRLSDSGGLETKLEFGFWTANLEET